ncbi:hypothetical protein Tco_1418990, partial [Tanacetum coccineum]
MRSTAMASEQSSLGPVLHEMTPATISLGFMPNLPPSTPFIPPSRTDWDILFQPMFDELLTPPPSVDYLASEVVAPIHEVVALVSVVLTVNPLQQMLAKIAPSQLITLYGGRNSKWMRIKRKDVDSLHYVACYWHQPPLSQSKSFRLSKRNRHTKTYVYEKDSSIALTQLHDAYHAGFYVIVIRVIAHLGSMLVSGRLDLLAGHQKGRKRLLYTVRSWNILDYVRVVAAQFFGGDHRERIEFLINKLGMRSFTPETLKQLADEAEELW